MSFAWTEHKKPARLREPMVGKRLSQYPSGKVRLLVLWSSHKLLVTTGLGQVCFLQNYRVGDAYTKLPKKPA